ncbi:G2/M phase-specific E3 ubiquitin-protein ligase-like [Mercenaria mercenaria]|uniref:G2/M phase-specific E3 ubiquitin-protein ligase-like n=1 Tax=Mercenaria mercenaria TaxID=6596 RepID=UPI00234F87C2|nr:G2/M phase-specific E3 ubiquitin-protein ligase-like [Mercenaria mercenaria]
MPVDDEVPCPVCGLKLPKGDIEFHASTCGESASTSIESNSVCGKSTADGQQASNEKGTLEESKDGLAAKIRTDTWAINVVRSRFYETALEELMEAVDGDWDKTIKIEFVGEEGIDVGGLSREFFTLLFKNGDIFENMSFHIDSELLEKKVYKTMGKAAARALIMGHPGPKCFHSFLAKFICFGQEPDFDDISYQDVGRADVLNAIEEITSDNCDLGNLMEDHGALLEQAGFRKRLTSNTVTEAVEALKRHFTFYHVTGALMQFREGLQLLGVLPVLQSYPESITFFTETTATAADIQEFFKPSYTDDNQELKKIEELIVYNFRKFLKKAERGKISTPWINILDETESEVTITTGHVLQALVGCETLPRISSGLLLFNHNGSDLTIVNTCAPSITFSQTDKIQEYENFEIQFMRVIVESAGFGIE